MFNLLLDTVLIKEKMMIILIKMELIKPLMLLNMILKKEAEVKIQL